MTSIFENTKSPVCIYILHDETLTQDNRQKFLRTAEKYNQEVNLIDVTEYAKQIQGGALKLFQHNYSIGAAFRFFIPELIKLDKTIYLDCDIIVNLDIKELWDTKLENYYAGVIRDEWVTKWITVNKNKYQILKCKLGDCDVKDYFNSGVMYMNLKELRKIGHLFEKGVTWLKRHKHVVPYADQDILNALFFKHVKFLDGRFNQMTTKTKDDLSNRIIHTPATPKSWQVTGSPAQYLYWHYYLKSAWGENITTPEQAFEVMLNASKIEKKPLTMKQITKNVLSALKILNLARISRMLFWEFLYRVGL